MAENRQKLVHLHTPDVKIPSQGTLDLGEIAVQHNNAEPALYIEKTNGEVAKFIDATAVDAKIEVEKLRAKGVEDGLADRINTLEGSNHTHANKTVLDGITTEKVSAWDAAEANAKKDAADKYQVKGDYETAGAAAQALVDAKAYADSKVDGKFDDKGAAAQALSDAKSYADGLAVNYDASGAAAQALSDAKTYADGLNTAMDGRVDVLETSSHTHSNKDVLDGITSAKVKAWDAAKANAISSAKTYADSLNTAMDSRVDILEASSHTHTNKTVLDGITSAKVTAWNSAKADAISSAKTYTDATIEALNLASTYEAKGTAQSLIDGLKLAETYASKGVESTISTLVGEDTGKSVRSVASEEVAKIVNSADTRYDTLKEIADWIINDTTGSAQMANDISALKAISADTRIKKLESKSHSHTNKSLLDTYTQTETDLADAVAKKHEHTNKGVLDGITSAKVTAWDAAKADAISSAKTYVDSLNTAMDSRVDVLETSSHTHANKTVLNGITAEKVTAWDTAEANAISSAITYTNTVLETIRIDCGTY